VIANPAPAPAPGRAPLSRLPLHLRLRDFRNFEALDWSVPAGSALLHGPNGAGKSSLVEAIYLASTTRSFRAAKSEHLARSGSDGFHVRLEVGRLDVESRPRRTLELAWSAARGKTRRVDGKDSALVEHLRVLPVLIWWRGEAEVVSGPPEARRRFFDRATVHQRPGYLVELGRYATALAEKRALLAAGESKSLGAWNRLLARHGAEVARARAASVADVRSELAGLTRFVTELGGPLPELGLRYRPSPAAALDGEEALFAELERQRAFELERRRPLVGPQRDEIELSWGGGAAKEVASAGERKALGLLLLAAQARLLVAAGTAPLLLVDDADAELDSARLARLVGVLGSAARTLFTTNRPELWAFAQELPAVDVGALAAGRN
jgi:DNA replication and repair protein RecF